MRWRTIALLGLLIGTWVGCSGESNQGAVKPEAHAGRGGAGRSGAGNLMGGTSGEGGEAGSDSEGGRAATPSSGGTAGRAGRGASGGMGAVAGASLSTGGMSTSAGRAGGGIGGTQGVPIAWGCSRSSYGDGVCDCGCGVPDSDCSRDDLKHCDVCNAFGSCNRAPCPGNIDPDDITKCVPAPDGWTCTPSSYGDGTTCDCGCGIQDKDCPDKQVKSCDSCQAIGTCANGPCPSALAPDDNTRCEIPVLWICEPYSYGDGTCDCGCGATDADCDDKSVSACDQCNILGCSGRNCSNIDPTDNSICSTPPDSWRCEARLYHDGVQCDCGCGFLDPDCASLDGDACDSCNAAGSCSVQPCPGIITPTLNIGCSRPPPPPEWTCTSYSYGDGAYCDCGCGAVDIDCRNDQPASCQECNACGSYTCPDRIDPTDTTKCLPPPSGWTCSAAAYDDFNCDCGCGIPDPACQGVDLLYVCQGYPVEGCSGGKREHIDPSHNALCSITIPTTWTCNRGYYDDGLCDCGCGAQDLDCASSAIRVCADCDGDGSCSTTACPGTIMTSDNAHCQ